MLHKTRGRPQKRFFRHCGIYRSDVSSHLFTPGPAPLSGRAGGQGIGRAGKNTPCPSSAMSSGWLFLDRVARLHCPSPLHQRSQHKSIAASMETNYHRTVTSVLTGCLTPGGHPSLAPQDLSRRFGTLDQPFQKPDELTAGVSGSGHAVHRTAFTSRAACRDTVPTVFNRMPLGAPGE